MTIIRTYFPELTNLQLQQLDSLHALYSEWNSKINVISRKDMDFFFERHVLHSLAISKVISFQDGTSILDVGTGGGFPGIPLSILFPKCHFCLLDSIGKKIKVVREVSNSLNLTNVRAVHSRVENIDDDFEFVVSRAVTSMPQFLTWIEPRFSSSQKNSLPNGVLYLKGGDLSKEMSQVKQTHQSFNLSNFFEEPFFETKKVVYVQMV